MGSGKSSCLEPSRHRNSVVVVVEAILITSSLQVNSLDGYFSVPGAAIDQYIKPGKTLMLKGGCSALQYFVDVSKAKIAES